MLRLLAEGPSGCFTNPCKVVVEIHRISGTRLADYWIEAMDAFGVPLDDGVLHDYPRWTEPLSAFAARCCSALSGGVGVLSHPVETGLHSVTILRGRRLLAQVHSTVSPDRSLLRMHSQDIKLPASNHRLWETMLAFEAFQLPALPPPPAPLRLPLHRTGATVYSRLADLPLEAREAFTDWRRGRPVGTVTLHPSMASPTEIARFLDGHH